MINNKKAVYILIGIKDKETTEETMRLVKRINTEVEP